MARLLGGGNFEYDFGLYLGGAFVDQVVGFFGGVVAAKLLRGILGKLAKKFVKKKKRKGRPNPNSSLPEIDEFEAGQGFSGVYDPKTGAVVMKPSTRDREAEIPDGWVGRRGGHHEIETKMPHDGSLRSREEKRRAFTVRLEPDGSLTVEFHSRSVNGEFDNGDYLPEDLRGGVLDALSEQTGRSTSAAPNKFG